MSHEFIKLRLEGGVAWVTMNRPERLNALNVGLTRELREFFTGLNPRSEARVVVLQGEGRAFCAGYDLKDAQVAGKGVSDMMEGQHAIRDIMHAMRRCPQPIISIVQGAAAGGGFALALASDIRLATHDARMNAAFIRIGLSGCDMGVSYFLPRMVGMSVASHYLLTGRFLDAARAQQLGLVSAVGSRDDMLAEAHALAQDMLHATPLGLRMTKEALGHAVDAGSMEAVTAMEDRNQILCTRGEDFEEGIAAFLEKRPPRYVGR
jgi:enoyl-CoA hydratase/carnithine racemase